jgi:Zn finger protein HypA/HybF involved in hydrogenase expression
MKNVFFLLLLSCSAHLFSQVLTEEDLKMKLKNAQDKCANAHPSIVLEANEEFAREIWGKKVRFNSAKIIRFFVRPSGEKVSAGVDILSTNKNSWAYSFDQKATADLVKANGVRVTQSFNTLMITANQNLLYAEDNSGTQKIILELYCPQQKFLEILRTGQTQSIEFLITGFKASLSSGSTINGVLTEVYAEKQVVKCSNGHEFDKALGYKFCPTCGEPLN